MESLTSRLRTGIIRGITGIVVTSTATSTVESYMGLRAWAAQHGDVGLGSYIFPGFIDAFPLAAEAALILAYLDHWKTRSRVLLWVILTTGLVVSVGLNVGHIYRESTDPWTWVTNGSAPVATWLSLVVGTQVFKRTMANKPADDDQDEEMELATAHDISDDVRKAQDIFHKDLAAGKVPGLNRIRKHVRVGHDKAPRIQKQLEALTTGR